MFGKNGADVETELETLHMGRGKKTALEEVINASAEAKKGFDSYVEKLRSMREKLTALKARRLEAKLAAAAPPPLAAVEEA